MCSAFLLYSHYVLYYRLDCALAVYFYVSEDVNYAARIPHPAILNLPNSLPAVQVRNGSANSGHVTQRISNLGTLLLITFGSG
jgi:hypothetical protein